MKRHKMEILADWFIGIFILLMVVATCTAQTISVEYDPHGSSDLEGINTVVTFGDRFQDEGDFKHLMFELQFQTAFNEWRSEVGYILYYADVQFGLGWEVPFTLLQQEFSAVAGAHVGMMFRPSEIIDITYDGYSGGLIYGLTGKFRWKVLEHFNIVLSSAYDYRWDLVRYGDRFRINNRLGIEYQF